MKRSASRGDLVSAVGDADNSPPATDITAQPLAVITGVAPGTGSALVRRFSAGGFQVAMLACNADRLARPEAECLGA